MKFSTRALLPALAALAVCASAPAMAQSSSSGMSGNNWRPYSGGGYVGLNVGRSDYGVGCGPTALTCDSTQTGASIYTGTWINPHLGLELGYLDMGSMDRAGGQTKARGLNFSVVGKVPLTSQFGAYGKVGTTYGRTTTSAVAGSGVTPGDENGWGLSYGLGLSYDITPQWAVVLDWQRHRFHFAGGRDDVDMTSLGVQYKF